MKWEELKKLGRQQWDKSATYQDYVLRYRQIPLEMVNLYDLGVIKLGQLKELEGLTEDLRAKLENDKSNKEWLMVPVEGLDRLPLGVELRQQSSGSFFKVYLPDSRIHPVLYGLPQALGVGEKMRQMAVVEGVFDLLTFASVTRFPVVAFLTKTPSKRQMRWCRRWLSKLLLFLDSDDEGRSAARSLAAFQDPGTLVVDTQWWEVPALELGKLKDLNDIARQLGWPAVRSILEYGLKK